MPEAGIESYVREFVFDRAAQKLAVTDTFRLADETADVESHYITIAEPEIGEGIVRIAVGEDTAVLRFDAGTAAGSKESHELEVAAKNWGAENVWRTVLRPKNAAKEHVLRAEIFME